MTLERSTRPAAAINALLFLVLFTAAGTVGTFVTGCGKKKCKSDADCPKDTACMQGKCVSFKGGPAPKGPNPFQRRRKGKPDPSKVYRVDVDPKIHPTRGPADALVTVVELSEFQ